MAGVILEVRMRACVRARACMYTSVYVSAGLRLRVACVCICGVVCFIFKSITHTLHILQCTYLTRAHSMCIRVCIFDSIHTLHINALYNCYINLTVQFVDGQCALRPIDCMATLHVYCIIALRHQETSLWHTFVL